MSVSTITLSSAAFSAFVSKLADDSPKTIKWLVIAHDSSEAIHAIRRALEGESVAVLTVPQTEWQFGDGELLEAIEMALQNQPIANLAIVGSSQAIEPPQQEDSRQQGYQRLVNGVRSMRSQHQASEDHFKAQMNQLLQSPVINGRAAEGALQIQGLLYRAESGTFLAYEASSESFRPLI